MNTAPLNPVFCSVLFLFVFLGVPFIFGFISAAEKERQNKKDHLFR